MRIGVPECVAQNLPRDVDSHPAGSIFPALWKGVFWDSDLKGQNLHTS